MLDDDEYITDIKYYTENNLSLSGIKLTTNKGQIHNTDREGKCGYYNNCRTLPMPSDDKYKVNAVIGFSGTFDKYFEQISATYVDL